MKKLLIALSLVALVGAGCSNAPAAKPSGSAEIKPSAEASGNVTTDQNGVSTLQTNNGGSVQFKSTPTKPASTQPSKDDEDVPVTDVFLGDPKNVITMEVSNFAFSPKSFTVKAGEGVKITFTKAEGSHTFVIDGITTVKAETKTGVIFTAPSKPGSYPFYCNVGTHRAMGMEGTMIVK